MIEKYESLAGQCGDFMGRAREHHSQFASRRTGVHKGEKQIRILLENGKMRDVSA